MKNLYFGSAVAMLAVLASCAQDELGLVAEKPVSNDLAGRKNVGVVTFVNAPETRFDYINAGAEKGEVLGVYLMDQFRDYSWTTSDEWENANFTPFQANWWNMYQLTNYISTNFGYTYDGEGHWVNKQAELIEGNYFATFPRCEEATNRRDLWHQFEGKRILEQLPDGYTDKNGNVWVNENKNNVFVNFENNFYVGYEQVYRDDENQHDGAELEQSLNLYSVSTNAHFVIADYDGGTQYRIKRIAIRRLDGQQVPTLVYVRPQSSEYYQAGIQDPKKFNQETARYITQFVSVPDATKDYNYVPYGYGEKAPIYQYEFDLPGENGFEMVASSIENEGKSNNDRLDIYVTLPTKNLSNYCIEVFADMWVKEGTERHWEEGVFTHGMITSTDNGDWTLDNVLGTLSQDGKTPMGYLRFDNKCWTPYRNYAPVADNDALWELLNSSKDEKDSFLWSGDYYVNVTPVGHDLDITPEVMKFVNDNNIILQFQSYDPNNGYGVVQKNLILNDGVVLNKRIQGYGVPAVVEKGSTVTTNGDVLSLNITNNGNLTISGDMKTNYRTVVNNGELTLKNNVYDVENYGTLIGTKSNIEYLYNYSGASASITNVIARQGSNDGMITVAGTFNNSATYFVNNNSIVVSSGNVFVDQNHGDIQNAGNVTVNYSDGTIETSGALLKFNGNNDGVITIENKDAVLEFVSTSVSGGEIINSVLANVINQPTDAVHVYISSNGDVAPAAVKNYNANGASINKLVISNVVADANKTVGVTGVTDAVITFKTGTVSGAKTFDCGAVNTILNGSVTVLAGAVWTVKGTGTVVDQMNIVVNDGGKLVSTVVSADIDYNDAE